MNFCFKFALDIVTRIRQALEEDKRLVLILPAWPIPQYRIAARLINELKIPLRHVHTFIDAYFRKSFGKLGISKEELRRDLGSAQGSSQKDK